MKTLKLRFFSLMLALATLFCVSACGGNEDEKSGTNQYQVTFVCNNGSMKPSITVDEGETVSTPSDPKKTNYIFTGWYADSSCNNKYDFSKPVTKDLTLYAKYEIDAATVTNKITTDTIKSVVKIYNKSYNTFLGFETSSTSSQGSGFCFHIQDNNYYILTNCHVARKEDSYDKQKFTIIDYQGDSYDGYLYKNPNKSMSAIAASYDLACLYFKSTSTNVQSLSIVNSDPDLKEDVIAVGAPEGQSNSITYGKISNYGTITLSNTTTSESDVRFDVVFHSAYINSGSSGGPLLNADLKVVGVNYAVSRSSTRSYAIPAVKVKEFLKNYVYN